MGKRSRKPAKPSGPPPAKPAAEVIENDQDHCLAYASDSDSGAAVVSTSAPAPAAAASPSSSSSSDASDGEIALGPSSDAMSDVDVSFDFFDPTPADAAALRTLLAATAGETSLDARAVADAVVAQTRVGTVVKVSDGDAAVAFVTALALGSHAPLFAGLRTLIAGGVADAVTRGLEPDVAQDDRSRHRVGVVLTERVVNLPPVLVAKMQEAVFCEIAWATEDEDGEAGRRAFRFAKFLYVTDAFCKPREGGGPDAKRRRKEDTTDFTFARPEDEAWMAAAADVCSWAVDGERPGAQGLTRRRVAMIVPAAKIPAMRKTVCEIVGVQMGDGGDGEEAAAGEGK